MDEEIRTRGLILIGSVYLFLSFLFGSLAITALSSYPDATWYAGLVLIMGAILLIHSGISNILKSKKKNEELRIQGLQMQQAATKKENGVAQELTNDHKQSSSDTERIKIFASWNYTHGEWEKFQKSEQSIRLWESLLLIIFITAGGAWMLYDDEAGDWFFSIGLCFVFAILFVAAKYFVSKSNFAFAKRKGVNVIIDAEKVFINGKLFYFKSDDRLLKNLTISDRKDVHMLEFTYQWKTRSGHITDTLLIPIPEDKKEEAVALIHEIRGLYGIVDQREWGPGYKWRKNA